MAANAAAQLLEKTGTNPQEIHQLVVSTESGVDHSKPVASFVQGLLKIGSRCRIYEIKHACYGGTAGIVTSIDWIARNYGTSKKALVIMTDTARYGFGSPGEPTQGAGAVALLMEKNPRLFSVDTRTNGIFSKDVFDFWRPTGHRVPIVDGKYSVACYLEAMEEAVSHFRSNVGIPRGRLLEHLDYILYHMPFTGMARKAHRHFVDTEHVDSHGHPGGSLPGDLSGQGGAGPPGGQRGGQHLYRFRLYGVGEPPLDGTDRVEGKRVGVFSYGSGCGGRILPLPVQVRTQRNHPGHAVSGAAGQEEGGHLEQYVQWYSKSGADPLPPRGDGGPQGPLHALHLSSASRITSAGTFENARSFRPRKGQTNPRSLNDPFHRQGSRRTRPSGG